MTVGAPCMEWKQCSKHTETKEGDREEYLLHEHRYSMRTVQVVGNLIDIHRHGTATEIDAQNTDQQKSGTAHQHQGKLHRCIFLRSTTPYTYQQIHRDQGYFIKHEHREQVGRDKESEHARRKQCVPKEIFLRQRLQLP